MYEKINFFVQKISEIELKLYVLGRGGANNQRLKVRPINISPPNSKKRE